MSPRSAGEAMRFWMKLLGGILTALLLMVWEHVEALNFERDLKVMHREADRLTYENGRMQMQIHQWTSPSHLESVARKDYNMAPVDAGHIIGVHKP